MKTKVLLSAGAAAMLLALTAGGALAEGADAAAGSFSLRPTPDQDIEHPKNPAREHVPTIRSWFSFQAQPGDQVRDSLRVANTRSVPVQLLLYPVDAATGVTSGLVMQNNNAPRNGVGKWLQVASSSVQLAPAETKDVDFTLAVPAEARNGEHWGGLMAEDTNVRKGSGQFSVDQVMRSGIAAGLTLPGPKVEKLSIKGISEKVVNNLNEVFVIDIANEGNVMVKPQGQFELKDAAGKLAGSQDLKLDNVLAGSTIPYEFFWPKDQLLAGKYAATVTLAAGPNAEPASLTVPNLDIQAPGARLVPAPAAGAAQAPAQIVAVASSAPSAFAGSSGSSGPLQTLMPALGGAAVVGLGLAAYQLGRRKS